MDTPQSTTIHKTYQERGYCSRAGYARIREVLRSCCWLYNRSLEQRKNTYLSDGKGMTMYTQMKGLTQLRKEQQFWRDIGITVSRGVLVRVDRAFKAFFRRVKAGEKPGYPRFKPHQRYQCLELASVTAGMVKGNRIKVKGLPVIKIRPNRRMPDSSQLKALRIGMHGRILTVDLVYEEEQNILAPVDTAVGIDMGVNERMTFSDGETVSRRVIDRSRETSLQRAISTKKKGSNRRRKAVATFARERRRNTVRNRNECHRLTTAIVRKYQKIAVEKLAIKNMSRRGGSRKRGLNRSMMEQTWGILFQQLRYKAEWAGRQFSEVDPRYTSKTCSHCGEVRKEKPAVYRIFECLRCGHTEDRDTNAAKNIKERGVGLPIPYNAGGNSPHSRRESAEKDMLVQLSI